MAQAMPIVSRKNWSRSSSPGITAFMQAMYGGIALNGAFFNTQRLVQQLW